MFYSHDILARKGPLGTIWIAAHLDRKLRKNQVLETDITVSVEAILSADLQKVLALRLSGHLLLGITRIFNRKVNYLYENCETALDKLKQAYKKGNVDLPKEQAVARYEDVTLPDQYVLPDLEAFSEIYATPLLSRKNQNKNVSRPEDITIVDKPVDNPFTDFNDEELPPVDDLDFAGPFDATPRSVEVNRSVATPVDDPFAERFEDDAGFFEPMDMDPEKMRSAPTGEGAQEDQELFPALDTPLAPTPMDKDDDTVPLTADAEAPLPDFDTQPKPAQGRDSLDLLLNGDAMLPTPIGEDLATPAAGGDVTQTKRTPKRRKVERVVFDQETVIPGAEMDRRIKNPGDLVRSRKRAAHTGRQIRLQASTQAGLEALMRMPAVSGLGLELQAVVRGMLVKGKPDFLPLTDEAEERRAADDKAKAEEAERKEQARHDEEAKEAEEGKGEGEKDAEAPAETDQAPPEPSPKENGIPATPHDDFPMTDDYVPTDDHYDHTMPDGNWDDTAPYPPGENVNKEKQAAGYPGLEDLLTGKTTEEASEVAEGDTPSEDVSAAGGVKGWSVRTRGVANRLQQVFREGGEEKSVPLEGLLEGYGRKTAAKMFFEVLVLKTSNYIDVKQEEPYGNVDLKPTPQLMAAAF